MNLNMTVSPATSRLLCRQP